MTAVDLSSRLPLASTFLGQGPAHFVAGASRRAQSAAAIDVVNPVDGETVGHIAAGDTSDVTAAVAAARQAFTDQAWAGLDPHERGRLLFAVAEAVDEHSDELAELDSLDTGMPLTVAKAFVAEAAKTFRYFAGWPTKIYGETNPTAPTMLSYSRREPLGVCALIVAWNGPLGMTAWKLAPALACGNTAVVKPAEQASLSPLRLAELVHEVGVPAGVVNVVTGLGEVAGAGLVAHPDIDKVSFTGSTETGARILGAVTGNSPT